MALDPNSGFSIPYGNGTIVVPDVSKPLWHGDYYAGKLSIFHAVLDDPEYGHLATIVCVFVDPEDNNFVLSAHYETHHSYEEIISDLQARVIVVYHQEKAKKVVPLTDPTPVRTSAIPPSIYIPGPSTLQ